MDDEPPFDALVDRVAGILARKDLLFSEQEGALLVPYEPCSVWIRPTGGAPGGIVVMRTILAYRVEGASAEGRNRCLEVANEINQRTPLCTAFLRFDTLDDTHDLQIKHDLLARDLLGRELLTALSSMVAICEAEGPDAAARLQGLTHTEWQAEQAEEEDAEASG